MNGVLFKLILISFPSPEAALSASAFKKFPFSFDPTEYTVLFLAPLTYLTSNSKSSSSVNSNTKTSFESVELIEIKKIVMNLKNIFII